MLVPRVFSKDGGLTAIYHSQLMVNWVVFVANWFGIPSHKGVPVNNQPQLVSRMSSNNSSWQKHTKICNPSMVVNRMKDRSKTISTKTSSLFPKNPQGPSNGRICLNLYV